MGYISCNSESAISTCDTYNLPKKNPKTNPHNKHYKIKLFNYTQLVSSTQSFSNSNFLGKGSHGSVYKAALPNNLTAAVKKTNNQSSQTDNEIETLSRIRSPRIVNLLGFGSDPSGKKLIVVEYMHNGSLYDLLHNNNTKPACNNILLAGLAKRIKIAIQIAKAVNELHTSSPPVIHRDIKSSNVLFDGKWKARLSDFGLALSGHVETNAKMRHTPPAGTLGYLDPCYLAPCDLTAKSDVFSFGILLLEIFSGRHAIDLRYSPPSIVEWAAPLIRSGEYGEVFDRSLLMTSASPSDDVIRQLAVLAAMCVKSTAAKRPEMTEVVESLIKVYKRMTSWRRVRYTRQIQVIESSDIKGCGGTRDGHVARSKSVGVGSEVKYGPLDLSMGDNNKRGGQGMCGMIRRSKSTGELLESKSKLVNKRNISGNGIVVQMIRNPNVRELESSKLLVKFSSMI